MDELTTFTLQATQAATYLKYLVRFDICMVVTNNRPYSRYPPSRIGGIKAMSRGVSWNNNRQN